MLLSMGENVSGSDTPLPRSRRSVWAPSPSKAADRRRRQGLDWAEIATIGGIFLLLLMVYLSLASAASTNGVLTGEEASVSFVDVVALPERWQFTHFSTNFGGHVYFFLTSFLDPSFDLFYGRRAKAFAMAALPIVVYLTLTRRLHSDRLAGFCGAVFAGFMPGILAFSWLAIESGLEVVVGGFGLLLATASSRGWWLSPILGGMAISVYGSGIPWYIAIVAVCLIRCVWTPRVDLRTALLRVGLSVVVSIAIVTFPLVWWAGGSVLTGGGSTGSDGAIDRIGSLIGELVNGTGSYYNFIEQPALGNVFSLTLCLGGLFMIVMRAKSTWPWLLVAGITLLMTMAIGNFPGVRRSIAILMVLALGSGLLVDRVIQLVGERRFAVVTVGLLLSITISISSMAQFLSARDALSKSIDASKIDFKFPLTQSGGMPQELDFIASELGRGRTWADLSQTWEGERASAMILLLSERGTISPVAITTSDVENIYRSGSRCETSCTSSSN